MADFEDWAGEEISGIRDGSSVRAPFGSQSMFRYIGLGTKTSWEYFDETLRAKLLRGGTANSLNDPFELQPSTFDDLSPDNILAAHKLVGYHPAEISRLDINNIAKFRSIASEYVEQVKTSYRIISFSDRIDSPLLWSHYANSYRGACLHFLGRAFGRNSGLVGYVEYTTSRPMYPLSLALSIKVNERKSDPRVGRLRSQSEKMFFFKKASDWAYEGEIRIAYNSRIQQQVRFMGDALVAIIVGPRMELKSIERLKAMVEKYTPRVVVRRAKLSSSTFSVDIDN